MTRLNGIQKAMVVYPSAFLLNLENDLLRDLDTILNQEEEIWALKSRVNWMIQRDRNMAFYHVSTLVRRKRNKILAIKNAVGDWIQQEEAVKDFVKNGYSEIYTTSLSSVSALPPTISSWQSRLSEEEKCSISEEVSEEEIKAMLSSLKAFKAPGPDGLHAGFFQRFWLTIGTSVINEVKKVFTVRRVSVYLNTTHIALIPKSQGPETLSNYRPISLCNMAYKIVSKIIVARLRPYLDKLISPCQSAFIPGRKGIDNVIIA